MFHTVYVSICVTFCALSILFDSILTKIARERAGRVGVYRYFTYSFVITDIVYSISYALTAPYWHSAPGVLVFFAASPLWEYYSLMKISMLVWWMSYVTILLCLASSFLYRYGLLCNTAVLEIFTTPWKTKTFLVSSFALFTVWMTLATQIIFHSEDELREDLQAGLDSAPFHVNFSAVYCLGVNIKRRECVK
ncbi:hypothetical protein PFISCL1PPCAC_13545 [Pristionchus fissidentatus]|uniref:G protein-coupled receptor n=1 Tax=Pristionchus fissidentatus TaxID=1538716 RepID=A0AAV5VS21_9BILA|nr:hypothetical protein PFISCL1PPCAC_13545 [Pristionchus fissidentatus]